MIANMTSQLTLPLVRRFSFEPLAWSAFAGDVFRFHPPHTISTEGKIPAATYSITVYDDLECADKV